jgi:predicted DNA-binding protein
MKIEKRIKTLLYLNHRQKIAMKKLSERTRVPMAAYFREAIDMLLAKYKSKGSQR